MSASVVTIQPAPREIRVFLSSTFRDMEAERNHLVKQVFPKVRAACLARQVGFTEIDLRWGVTEEESKNGATVEICLQEIDRCRDFPPFFIGFLGERYGWIPKHEDLTAYWQKHRNSSYAKPVQHAVKRGISVTELEMELGVLEEGAADKIASHALFLLRDRTLTDQLYRQDTGKPPNPQDAAYYDPAGSKLLTLKDRIRSTPFLGIDGYTTVEQFGEAIETYLLGQLELHFPADDIPSPQERQRQAHAAFRYHRLQNYLPRDDVRKLVLKALQKRIDAPTLGPVLLAGPSGQGKSALMADLARHLEATHPEWIVLDHYIGADDTNSLDSWARRILETLHPRIHDLVDAVPEAPKDQKEALSTWIAMTCRRHEQNTSRETGSTRLILVLDALDQCRDGGKDLELLKPEILGPDALVIVSAADGTPAREAAKDYETQMVPSLTAKLKARMIRDTLARFRKKLAPELAQRLAEAQQSGSPLFLSLALEELRLDASHESLADLITEILKAEDAEQLFLNRFLLDEDYGRPELPTLAAAFMALLGASHAGLSENELSDLLAFPIDPKSKDTKKPRLPQIHLSRLLSNFQTFLLNKADRRAPMHRIFGKAAMDYYGTVPVREHLYDHFKKSYGKGKDQFDARGAAEALHQISELAKLPHPDQLRAQKKLVADLSYLPLPLQLCEEDEVITLSAFTLLTDREKLLVAREFERQITSLDKRRVQELTVEIERFGIWISYFGHYHLSLSVLSSLVTSIQKFVWMGMAGNVSPFISLGHLYVELGRIDDAEETYQVASQYAQNKSDVAELSSAHACLLIANEDFIQAVVMLREAVSIFRKIYGEKGIKTLSAMSNLAVALSHIEDVQAIDEAKTLFKQVVEIERAQGGDCDPAHARVLENYGSMLTFNDDLTGAEPLLRCALEIMEKCFGIDHSDTASTMSKLADLLMFKASPEEARTLYGYALVIHEKTLGYAHPLVIYDKGALANSLLGVAVSLRNAGQIKNAERELREAMELFMEVHGEYSLEGARAYSAMGMLLKLKGEIVEAENFYRKSLAIREERLGSEDESTQLVRSRLDELLATQGK